MLEWLQLVTGKFDQTLTWFRGVPSSNLGRKTDQPVLMGLLRLLRQIPV